MLTPTENWRKNNERLEADVEENLYSRFQHLIDAIRPSHDPEVLRVAAITGYFDTSGKASSASAIELVVSGFVSTRKKWNRFEEQWQAVLEEFEVPYFHMKEFGPSTGVF